jgi:hypothetical protein
MKTDKITPAILWFVMCSGLIIFFTGCLSNVSGIKPVYPKTYETVDSLQPEVKWEGDSSKKYDLAIWDSVTIDILPQKHKIIYQRTGLNGNSHKLEIVLEPSKWYFWSVRETGSEQWSTIKTDRVLVARGYSDEVFVFITPKK